MPRLTIQNLLRGLDINIVLEDEGEETGTTNRGFLVNHTPQHYWVRSKDRNPIEEQSTIILENQPMIDWIGGVYRLNNLEGLSSLLCPLPNVLLIRKRSEALEDKNKEDRLRNRFKDLGLRIDIEKSKYLGNVQYCIVTDAKRKKSYEIRDLLLGEEGNLIEEIWFENMPLVVPSAMIPNDPLYFRQWNMKKIKAEEGWNLSLGDSRIVVCILDSGCDLKHPDLKYSTDGVNLGDMRKPGTPCGRPEDLNHGTACAGIAVAQINNNIGVAGVAGSCSIMPLAWGLRTDEEAVIGIRYATDKGAKVINMSFGCDIWSRERVDSAIQYAFDKGVIMCASTHNQNSVITYPATNRLVIACGASDESDNRWLVTHERGSNFGPQISVTAPGANIPTTSISGSGNDYLLNFSGTSAATPHVAGLAALLLSIKNALTTTKSKLTNIEVRNIIERTADRDKVGTVSYAYDAAHPNGLWNQEMGYGRINILNALKLAYQTLGYVYRTPPTTTCKCPVQPGTLGGVKI